MQVDLALYKGKGMVGNALIRAWTRSPYSHCELVVNGISMSSSLMDGGVRAKTINFMPEKWDVISLPWASGEMVIEYFDRSKDESYSLLDLARSQFFNHASDQPRASFCSEWCAAALGLPNPVTYSPKTFGELCVYLNAFKA